MISKAQRMATRHWAAGSKHEALRSLEAMWTHRKDWWFAHVAGNVAAEAKAAAKAAAARADLMRRTSLVQAQVNSWEREWDDFFEAWFRKFGQIP
jgi:hypothetical protein